MVRATGNVGFNLIVDSFASQTAPFSLTKRRVQARHTEASAISAPESNSNAQNVYLDERDESEEGAAIAEEFERAAKTKRMLAESPKSFEPARTPSRKYLGDWLTAIFHLPENHLHIAFNVRPGFPGY